MYALQMSKSKNNYCTNMDVEEKAPYNILMHVFQQDV